MGYLLDRSAWPEASRVRNMGMGQLLYEMLTFYGTCRVKGCGGQDCVHGFNPHRHKVVRDASSGDVHFDHREPSHGLHAQSVAMELQPEHTPVARSPGLDDWHAVQARFDFMARGDLLTTIRSLQRPLDPCRSLPVGLLPAAEAECQAE